MTKIKQYDPALQKQIIKKNSPAKVSSNTQSLAEVRQNVQAEELISQAIDKGVAVETLERLLAFAKEVKAIKAKEEFNGAMAQFQSNCPTIVKTKEVKSNGQVLYKYAPIESIVEQVKPFLQANGFSYSTKMKVLPDGVEATVKVTHILGHSEESSMQVPLGNKTQIMSASQQTAAASTFAKRYAFCNAFGILTGDDDVDGQTDNLSTQVSKTPQTAKSESTDPTQNKTLSKKQALFIKSLRTQKGLDQITDDELRKMSSQEASVEIKRLQDYQPTIQLDESLPPYQANHEGD